MWMEICLPWSTKWLGPYCRLLSILVVHSLLKSHFVNTYLFILFPGIHSIGHTVKIAEGNSIHLACLHTSPGNVEIDWFKDKGQNVRHSEGRALGRMSIQKDRLEINHVRSQDAGNYSCHVKAWQGDRSDSITYTLVVLSKCRYINM